MEHTINIKLTLNDINAVLRALGNRPYAEVANLIDNISGQAQAALRSEEEAATENDTADCDREG